ncbi:polymorphic toxin-type HINT domain-containing protein [Streptomyces sp. CS62]
MLAVEQAFGIFGKAKRFAKAMARAVQMFKKWSDEVAWAARTLTRADDDAKAMAKYSEDMAEWQRKADADAAAAKKADEVKTPAAEKTDSGGSGEGGGGGGGSRSGGESGPTCNSFMPGTRVLMADGTTKAIEDLELGDKVVATDPETGETAVKDVAATITGEGSKNLVEVTIDTDGDKGTATAAVTATDGHPFWVPEISEWVDATDLKAGTWLRTSAGTHVQITAVKRWTQQAKVHNLTVADIHTYYVLAAATPVLVHNCGTADERAHARASANAAFSSRPHVATGGYLWIKGHGEFDLSSDRLHPLIRANMDQIPAAASPGGGKFFGSHVEVQAATIMRILTKQSGSGSEGLVGRLMVSKPGGPCGFCGPNVPGMLPTNSSLAVRSQLNQVFSEVTF